MSGVSLFASWFSRLALMGIVFLVATSHRSAFACAWIVPNTNEDSLNPVERRRDAAKIFASAALVAEAIVVETKHQGIRRHSLKVTRILKGPVNPARVIKLNWEGYCGPFVSANDRGVIALNSIPTGPINFPWWLSSTQANYAREQHKRTIRAASQGDPSSTALVKIGLWLLLAITLFWAFRAVRSHIRRKEI